MQGQFECICKQPPGVSFFIGVSHTVEMRRMHCEHAEGLLVARAALAVAAHRTMTVAAADSATGGTTVGTATTGTMGAGTATGPGK